MHSISLSLSPTGVARGGGGEREEGEGAGGGGAHSQREDGRRGWDSRQTDVRAGNSTGPVSSM